MPQQFTVEYQQLRQNIIFNPSFENNVISGTGTDLNMFLVMSPAAGVYALQTVTTNSSTSVYYETPQSISKVVAGKAYNASAFVANTVGTTRGLAVSIRWYTSAGSLISESASSPTVIAATGAYIRPYVSAVAPSNALYATICVYVQATVGASGNITTIDALLLEPTTSLTPLSYFDGSYSGARWTGAINDSVSTTAGTEWVALDYVQQVSAFVGRQQLQDTFDPSRMSVSARYPSGYLIPNNSLIVDTPMRVKRTGSTYIMWTGRIRNVTVQYEIPYNSTTGVGVADHVDIECEGHLAQWGRLQGNGYYLGANNLYYQLADLAYTFNLQIGTTYTDLTSQQMSASEVTDSLSNWLNTACATSGSTIKDSSDDFKVGVYGRDWAGDLPVQFSDTTNDSTHQVYDSIIFDSVSADYFTEIELNTTSYGDVVVTTGIEPHRTLRQTTFNASASQATDLANYLLGIYGDNGFGISEISCKSEAQNTWNLDLGYGWWDIVGYSTYVTFRGQQFRCVIVGASFTATPSESRFTYYLADIGMTPFLILDDAGAGILDTNKLGW